MTFRQNNEDKLLIADRTYCVVEHPDLLVMMYQKNNWVVKNDAFMLWIGISG